MNPYRNIFKKYYPKGLEHLRKEDDLSLIEWYSENLNFWLSVKEKKKCIFSRRIGVRGRNVGKYNIRLRLFGKEIW